MPLIQTLFTLLTLLLSSIACAQGYSVQATPAWVQPIPYAADTTTEHNGVSSGVAYLLVDKQWQITERTMSRHSHIVSKALNTSGVTSISQITINFDPSYETLTLHQIAIHRDGQLLDRLTRSQISLLQREQELSYQIYDGTHTLNAFIEDVRVGDSIEYSYTVSGSNPVLSDHFSEALQLQWSVPVAHANYRLLWPSRRPLYVTPQNTDETLVQQVHDSDGITEYTWRGNQISEMIEDDGTPGWYQPYPVIHINDMSSWEQVVSWAKPLYESPKNTPLQNDVIRRILRTANTPELRVLAALRFVQDEVRYLGIEMGARSHKPSTPDKVLTQRFGDCKDKSRLLVGLLQGLGIQASPVLVHNTRGQALIDEPASLTAFNHAIVLARLHGKTFWLDPTRTHQSGSLNALYQPDYDYALVLADGETGLTKMSDDVPVKQRMRVEETIDVSQDTNGPASYTVITHHDGSFADNFRQRLASSNPSQLQRTYLNYSAKYFPGIETAADLDITDDPLNNRVTVTEQYRIPNIWEKTADGVHMLASFRPYLIEEQIKDVSTPVRTMPYAISHPVRYQQTTRIRVPPNGEFEDESQDIHDPAFDFSKRVSFLGDVLTLDYRFTSRKDHVPAADIRAYSDNIRTAQNLAYYSIQRVDPAINFDQNAVATDDINWNVIAILAAAIACLVAIAFYVYRYDPPPKTATHNDSQLKGLGGWLVVVGIGLVLSPLRLIIWSKEYAYILSIKKWVLLEQQLGETAPYIDLSALIVNVSLAIFAITVCILFFKKRRSFPVMYISFIVLALAVHWAYLAIWQLSGIPEMATTSTDISRAAYATITAAIWVAYALRSKRVRATFTRPRKLAETSPDDRALEQVTLPQPDNGSRL